MKIETAVRTDRQQRAILTVIPHPSGWAVEVDGETFDPSGTKEEARAAASRRAHAFQEAGRPCQINVSGETGFFRARPPSAPGSNAARLPELSSAPVEAASVDAPGDDGDPEETHPAAGKTDLVRRDRAIALQLRFIS